MVRPSEISLLNIFSAFAGCTRTPWNVQAAKTGNSRKYPDLGEYKGNLLEMPLLTGKTVGESTKEELRAVAEAYNQLAPHFLKAGKTLNLAAKMKR